MPARWLVKTEPTEYAYADLAREGHVTWDGVSNALALIHLRAMSVGDEVLVYHTGKEKAVVGLARVSRGPRPDADAPRAAASKSATKKPAAGKAVAATSARAAGAKKTGTAGGPSGGAAGGAKATEPPMRTVVVDFEPVAAAEHAVSLAAIRAEPRCKDLALMRQPRLSVMPVDDAAWAFLVGAAGLA